MINTISRCAVATAIVLFAPPAPAAPAAGALEPLLRDYLDKGLAEFNVYEAVIPQYGLPREAAVTHVWVKEPWDAARGVKSGGPGGGDFEVLKLNQIISFPTGLYRYEQMWSGFWSRETGQLVKFSLTHHEACGNTFKQGRFNDRGALDHVQFSYFENEGDKSGTVTPPADALFYDELPLRLRLLALEDETSGPLTLPLYPSVIHARTDPMTPAPATITRSRDADGRTVFHVRHAGGDDTLVFEAAHPARLLEWRRADGGSLKLKSSLFTDYWNKTSPEDAPPPPTPATPPGLGTSPRNAENS